MEQQPCWMGGKGIRAVKLHIRYHNSCFTYIYLFLMRLLGKYHPHFAGYKIDAMRLRTYSSLHR